MEKQKWINEGGIFFPIPGYATIYSAPGNGVFQIYENQVNHRMGLEKIDDAFVFDFKLYDLGCEDIFERVLDTWTSETFSSGNKNLGVIFNGLKGTGKTIAAKVLSNRIGLPVVVVSRPSGGLLEFIQSLCFECVILIDEAEKTFEDEKELLLKMIDGVYNASRKLYLLTTNALTVDENLIGRPGRIRYIKQFGNLSTKAVDEYIKDNLRDMGKRREVLELVDRLSISTIDILKAIIDEVNIHGEVPSGEMLNVPLSKYVLDVIRFSHFDSDRFKDLRKFIVARHSDPRTLSDWLRKKAKESNTGESSLRGHRDSNEDVIRDRFDCWVERETILSDTPSLFIDQVLREGVVLTAPDEAGFFIFRNRFEEEQLCCLIGNRGIPSLYHGSLMI